MVVKNGLPTTFLSVMLVGLKYIVALRAGFQKVISSRECSLVALTSKNVSVTIAESLPKK